jgi:hypothetical protein
VRKGERGTTVVYADRFVPYRQSTRDLGVELLIRHLLELVRYGTIVDLRAGRVPGAIKDRPRFAWRDVLAQRFDHPLFAMVVRSMASLVPSASICSRSCKDFGDALADTGTLT